MSGGSEDTGKAELFDDKRVLHDRTAPVIAIKYVKPGIGPKIKLPKSESPSTFQRTTNNVDHIMGKSAGFYTYEKYIAQMILCIGILILQE